MEEKQSMYVGTCLSCVNSSSTACVPIKICPFADTETISIECCGSPVIRESCDDCRGTINGRNEFTVSQNIMVSIPIVFGADVVVGDTYVQNGQTTVSTDGSCCSCTADVEALTDKTESTEQK